MRPYPPAGSVRSNGFSRSLRRNARSNGFSRSLRRNARSNGFSRSPFFARLDALGLAYTYRGKEAPQ